MDQRDDLTWIALELTPAGEAKVEDGTLAVALRTDLGVTLDFPVFIPATTYTKGARPITLILLEGYAFVGSGLSETAYFALEKRPYVAQVMSVSGGPHRIRTLSVISRVEIDNIRRQLHELVSSDISLGEPIHVAEGMYKGLDGQVIELIPDNACVHLRLRSLEIVATIPLVFLESLSDH